MNAKLAECLKKLRLSGMAQTLEVRLQEATANRLDHAEFLELVLADELAVRQERQIARGLKAAGFREQKTLEDFDWDFNRSIKKKQIYDLAAGGFVRQHRDVLLAGPPGVGKSHLGPGDRPPTGPCRLHRALPFDLRRRPRLPARRGLRGARPDHDRYLKPDLLILDDMGLKQLPKRSGEYLFEIIMRRHELRSTMMTSNRPLEDWGKLMGDVPAATAILDRLLANAEILQITGKSYRLRRSRHPTSHEKGEADRNNHPNAPTGARKETALGFKAWQGKRMPTKEERRSEKKEGPGSLAAQAQRTFSRPGLVIPRRVAPQQSPTPFHQATGLIAAAPAKQGPRTRIQTGQTRPPGQRRRIRKRRPLLNSQEQDITTD